jgi:mannosyltransferase OCH1-like enzyme
MIPKKIYQSWKTKDLSIKMKEAVQKTKDMNLEYTYELMTV